MLPVQICGNWDICMGKSPCWGIVKNKCKEIIVYVINDYMRCNTTNSGRSEPVREYSASLKLGLLDLKENGS